MYHPLVWDIMLSEFRDMPTVRMVLRKGNPETRITVNFQTTTSKQNSVMKTSAMLGSFRDSQKTREEFLSLLQMRP